MSFASILSPQAVIAELKASSKKQLLQEMSHCAAHLTGISGREILHVLLQREQLGSTAQGKGVAVPHGKMEGLENMIAVFARLPQPVSFEA
ncbi:MAG: PTS sugar transporter subunit IIA, partial [Parvibaculales bacterium]